MVTVLHPAAFESELVRLENEVAGEAGVPIIPFLDADTHAWADVAHLQAAHPAVFAVPVIEYRRAYHRQARQLLIAKAKGEKMSGASAALETPAGVLARMLRDLAARMRELTAAGSLPADGAGELCRACEELVGELGRLSAAALDDDAVLDAVSSLRDTVEAVIELVEDAGRPRGGARPRPAADAAAAARARRSPSRPRRRSQASRRPSSSTARASPSIRRSCATRCAPWRRQRGRSERGVAQRSQVRARAARPAYSVHKWCALSVVNEMFTRFASDFCMIVRERK